MGLFDVLRNFADKSGGEWIKENRHSTWIEIGDLFLNKKYGLTPDILTYTRIFSAPWLALLIMKILSHKSSTLAIITIINFKMNE